MQEVITVQNASEYGLSPLQFRREVSRGNLRRIGPGQYVRFQEDEATHASRLAEFQQRYPLAVVCDVSAAWLHGLMAPPRSLIEIHLALPASRGKQVHERGVRVQLLRNQQHASDVCVMRHVSGVELRVYSPARTVIDLYLERSRLGRSLYLEVMQQYLRVGHSRQQLLEMAREYGVMQELERDLVG